jgi:hypothetical protein
MGFWREYYILGNLFGYRFQIINNWHEFKTDEWHLLSAFRKYYNRAYSYFFCFFGFQLRVFESEKQRYKRNSRL